MFANVLIQARIQRTESLENQRKKISEQFGCHHKSLSNLKLRVNSYINIFKKNEFLKKKVFKAPYDPTTIDKISHLSDDDASEKIYQSILEEFIDTRIWTELFFFIMLLLANALFTCPWIQGRRSFGQIC